SEEETNEELGPPNHSEYDEEVIAMERLESDLQLVENMLKDNFSTTMRVEFNKEEKLFQLTPTNYGFVIEVVEIMQGKRSIDQWNQMKYSMADLSGKV